MLLANERELIARFGRRLTGDRLVVGTSGNLSIRDGDLLAVTPSGHAYDTLTPELVCVNRLDGSQVEGELAPTGELPIHQLIYEHTDAVAVVHTHSTAATVVSTLVEELPTIHYILAVMGGPIRVAPYATFGSQELADNLLTPSRAARACCWPTTARSPTAPPSRSPMTAPSTWSGSPRCGCGPMPWRPPSRPGFSATRRWPRSTPRSVAPTPPAAAPAPRRTRSWRS